MSDIDVGAMAEALNDKMDRDGNNIESPKLPVFLVAKQTPTSANNYTFYWKYSDGFVIQGQYRNTANTTFTFPVPMGNTDYVLVGVGFCIANYGRQSVSKSTTGFSTSSAVQQCETNGYCCFGYTTA